MPDAEASRVQTRSLLGSENWIRAVESADGPAAVPGNRWRQPAIDDLLSGPPERRPDLRTALADDDPVVAANAAICLARSGDPAGAQRLVDTVRDRQRKLPLRLAAAEALGGLDDPAATAPVGQLLDIFGTSDSGRGGASYVPEIHAELIRGLGRHVDPAVDRHMIAALGAESAEVRLAALGPWTQRQCGPLPVEAVDLRADPDPRVRAAALGALARQRHPMAQQHLAVALADNDFEVRLAALAALGQLGGSEAESLLVGQLRDDAELIRAAAVSALAELGARAPVLEAASDRSWRVRSAAAQALARYPGPDAAQTAHQLLDDPSSMVRRDVVGAVAEWPLAQSGPILLEAMGGAGYDVRHAAARQLARSWPPATEFPVDGPDERRRQVLAELDRQFHQQFDVAGHVPTPNAVTNDPSVRPVAAIESLPALLQTDGNASELIQRLSSADVSVRRQAAAALARHGGRPLEPSLSSRLAEVMLKEPDPLVWQSVLAAVRADGSEPSMRLAYVAIGHASAEVRRRACENLAAHPDPSHAAVLLPALEDPVEAVRLAAVEALAAAGRLDDAEPLKRLLASTSGDLRLAAAVALCRLKDPAGPAAVERLSLSSDPTERRQVAEAMGRLADPSFAAALVRLLDDRPTVRDAALASLPKIAGRDITETPAVPPPDPARRIELWKAWQQDQPAAPDSPPDAAPGK